MARFVGAWDGFFSSSSFLWGHLRIQRDLHKNAHYEDKGAFKVVGPATVLLK